MLDRNKVPGITVLMSQNDALGVRMLRIGLFQPVLQILCLSGGGFDDEDVIDISPFCGLTCVRRIRLRLGIQSQRNECEKRHGASE